MTAGRAGPFILAALCSAHVSAETPRATATFQCLGGETIQVQVTPRKASVHYAGKIYTMDRRASSIGIKFIAPGAALILDGAFAAFVADDAPLLRQCRSAQPLAVK